MAPDNLSPTAQANRPTYSPTPTSPGGKANGKCVAALVLGICAVVIPFTWFILGILAIIFGIMGLHKVKTSGERGKGMAIVGIVLGAIGVVVAFFLLMVIAPLAYFGVLNPSHMLPERTSFSAPFINVENAVVTTDGVVKVPLVNAQGSIVVITGGAIIGSDIAGDCAGATLRSVVVDNVPAGLPVSLPNGQDFVLEFQCSPKGLGEDFRATLGFNYRTETGIDRVHTGSVMATVQ